MPWTANIPGAAQTLANSQPQIRDNFTEIFTDFGTNHVGLTNGTVADRGKHNFVALKVQVADPAIANNNEAIVFTKQVLGVTQLFWKRFGGAAVQLTGRDPLSAANGYTFLPGNILMQWGNNVIPNGNAVVPFNIPFSAPPYSITLQPQRSNVPVVVGYTVYVRNDVGNIPTAAQFETINGSSAPRNVYWIAIGPA